MNEKHITKYAHIVSSYWVIGSTEIHSAGKVLTPELLYLERDSRSNETNFKGFDIKNPPFKIAVFRFGLSLNGPFPHFNHTF